MVAGAAILVVKKLFCQTQLIDGQLLVAICQWAKPGADGDDIYQLHEKNRRG